MMSNAKFDGRFTTRIIFHPSKTSNATGETIGDHFTCYTIFKSTSTRIELENEYYFEPSDDGNNDAAVAKGIGIMVSKAMQDIYSKLEADNG